MECLEKFLSGSYIAVSLNFHLLKFDDYCYVFLSNIAEWKIGYVIATVILSTRFDIDVDGLVRRKNVGGKLERQ